MKKRSTKKQIAELMTLHQTYNHAQVARLSGLDTTAIFLQCRKHYPICPQKLPSFRKIHIRVFKKYLIERAKIQKVAHKYDQTIWESVNVGKKTYSEYLKEAKKRETDVAYKLTDIRKFDYKY